MRLALLTAVLICVAGPAFAGWNNTSWGMSDAQVRALYPTVTEVAAGADNYLELKGQIRFAGVTWETVSFHFSTKGQLRYVRMRAREPFSRLRDDLAGQLGTPVVSEDHDVLTLKSHKAIFRDPAKGNVVELYTLDGASGLLPSSTISYQPLRTGY